MEEERVIPEQGLPEKKVAKTLPFSLKLAPEQIERANNILEVLKGENGSKGDAFKNLLDLAESAAENIKVADAGFDPSALDAALNSVRNIVIGLAEQKNATENATQQKIADLKEKLAVSKQNYADLAAEMQQGKEKIGHVEDLETKYLELEKALEIAVDKGNSTEKKAAWEKQKFDDFKAMQAIEITGLKAEKTALQETLNKVQQDFATEQVKSSRLEENCKNFSEKLEKSEENLRNAFAEKAAAEEKAENVILKAQELEKELAIAQQNLQNMQQNLAEKVAEIAELKAKNAELAGENSALNATFSKIKIFTPEQPPKEKKKKDDQ